MSKPRIMYCDPRSRKNYTLCGPCMPIVNSHKNMAHAKYRALNICRGHQWTCWAHGHKRRLILRKKSHSSLFSSVVRFTVDTNSCLLVPFGMSSGLMRSSRSVHPFAWSFIRVSHSWLCQINCHRHFSSHAYLQYRWYFLTSWINPQAYGYRCSFHPKVFQGIVFTEEHEYII